MTRLIVAPAAVAPVLSDGRGLKHGEPAVMHQRLAVAPVLSDGRGLKQGARQLRRVRLGSARP